MLVITTKSFVYNTYIYRLVQGVLLLKPGVTPDGVEGSKVITRLFVHEIYRVFYDRLVDEADRATFFGMVKVRILSRELSCMYTMTPIQ